MDVARCVPPALSGPANKLDAMERLDIDDNCPLVVLDGQTSIEELFGELGFTWQVDPLSPSDTGIPGTYGQATLF